MTTTYPMECARCGQHVLAADGQHQEAWQSPNFDEPLDDGEQVGESFQ